MSFKPKADYPLNLIRKCKEKCFFFHKKNKLVIKYGGKSLESKS